MIDQKHPELMNVTEVASYLRVAPATVYRLAQRGLIPCGKVGRSWRFHRETIDRWIASQQPKSLKNSRRAIDDGA